MVVLKKDTCDTTLGSLMRKHCTCVGVSFINAYPGADVFVDGVSLKVHGKSSALKLLCKRAT